MKDFSLIGCLSKLRSLVIFWGLGFSNRILDANRIFNVYLFRVGEALIFGTMMVGQSMAFAPNYNKAKVSGARILRLLDRVPSIVSPIGSSPQSNVLKMIFAIF
jgi:hypothetical protein